ncbi:MAG: hypothetical protein A2020_03330 [Lentisphaerae bacterium GWF2_45_14]|nr:MAG: hypothetical protein A2020_03330 [Lentisphaerae bacterium GWF2_45_14]
MDTINNSGKDKYPAYAMKLQVMNRVVRHRLRNLCAGVRMTVERIASVTEKTHPDIPNRCKIICTELDSLQIFTDRMDTLFDTLPTSVQKSLFELLAETRDCFARKNPLSSLDLSGPEENISIKNGSWFVIALGELLDNAAEASGPQGNVKMKWSLGKENQSFKIIIENTSEPIAPGIPINPPVPFHTERSRHDGLGMAIAYRICSETNSGMVVENSPDKVKIIINFAKEEIINE